MAKAISLLFFCFISISCYATSCEKINNRQPIFDKYINTIGDSITWQGDGQYFRCLMRDNGLAYEFIGNYVDRFLFNHDGEGGNTTAQLIQRLQTIPISDAYFLLIGINDILQNVPTTTTFNNIVIISNALNQKNKYANIYISTLLPTIYKQNSDVQKLNKILLQARNLCDKCKVIDVGGQFYKLQDWPSYLIEGIHPNIEGYKQLSKFVVESIQ